MVTTGGFLKLRITLETKVMQQTPTGYCNIAPPDVEFGMHAISCKLQPGVPHFFAILDNIF
jgi:hypothetical protein